MIVEQGSVNRSASLSLCLLRRWISLGPERLDHRLRHRDEFRARAFAARGLPADASSLEEKCEGIGQDFRLRYAGGTAQYGEAVALFGLHFFYQAASRMSVFREFDRCVR